DEELGVRASATIRELVWKRSKSGIVGCLKETGYLPLKKEGVSHYHLMRNSFLSPRCYVYIHLGRREKRVSSSEISPIKGGQMELKPYLISYFLSLSLP